MKRLACVVGVAVMALALTACGPSQAQLACEEAGGTYVSTFTHYTYIWTGKSMVPIPNYRYECLT